MAVTIQKTFSVQEPIEKVWAFLSDPRKVVTCVPGAQITEQVDERTYKGAISVKVGPSVTDYKGEVQIVRLDPAAYEMELLGKGQDVRGKGSASMRMTGKLRMLESGEIEVSSMSELSLVGILAQMGGRVVNEVSNIMFQKFSNNFRQKLQEEHTTDVGAAGPVKPIGAVGLAFSALKASFAREKKAEPQPSQPPEAIEPPQPSPPQSQESPPSQPAPQPQMAQQPDSNHEKTKNP